METNFNHLTVNPVKFSWNKIRHITSTTEWDIIDYTMLLQGRMPFKEVIHHLSADSTADSISLPTLAILVYVCHDREAVYEVSKAIQEIISALNTREEPLEFDEVASVVHFIKALVCSVCRFGKYTFPVGSMKESLLWIIKELQHQFPKLPRKLSKILLMSISMLDRQRFTYTSIFDFWSCTYTLSENEESRITAFLDIMISVLSTETQPPHHEMQQFCDEISSCIE